MERSVNNMRARSSPWSLIVGPHQASSSRCVAAPISCAACSRSPVFPGQAADQSLRVGPGRYCSRNAWLCSKPPEARITPRRARTRRPAPPPPSPITTPLTRPPSRCKALTGLLSHNATPRSSSERRRRPIRALPMTSRRERRPRNRPGMSLTYSASNLRITLSQPGDLLSRTAPSRLV